MTRPGVRVCARIVAAMALTSLLSTSPAVAQDHPAAVRQIIDSQIRTWLDDPVILNAIRQSNQRNASLTTVEVGRLDTQWRAELDAAEKPLMDQVMSRPASAYLKQIKERGAGLYTEIFVMDARGLNVAQSDVTSDFWQGDEAKWQLTFLLGRDAEFIDGIEFDESAQLFQCQVSLSIADPLTGEVIGAITVGVNADELP